MRSCYLLSNPPPQPKEAVSAKCAKLFTFKNTARPMKDYLLTVPTSEPKPRAVSSSPSFSLTLVGFGRSLPMRGHAFFKIIILCLSISHKRENGPWTQGRVVDTDAGCVLVSRGSRLSPARLSPAQGPLGTQVCDRGSPQEFWKSALIGLGGVPLVPRCHPSASESCCVLKGCPMGYRSGQGFI